MKHIKRIRVYIAIYVVAIFGFGAAVPAFVNADTPQPETAKQSVCKTLDGTADCSAKNTGGLTIDGIVRAIVNIFSFVIGVVAVIMMMVGGYRYITSGGDSNKIASAKGTITYAIIGIIVTVLAQGVVRFVLNKVQ